MHVLIVEDEPGLQFGLDELFRDNGYSVTVCGTGREALSEARSALPDVVILDLGLPDMDGTSVLSELQECHPGLPILVLTARSRESEIVLGFKLGAMDYVCKPFSPRILLARVEALVRRMEKPATTLALGSLEIDLASFEAHRNGQRVHFSTREWELLKFLHAHRGKPVSRHDILDEVWGLDSEAGPRTVDTYVAALRKKIERDPRRPRFLLSQRGIGYKLVL